MNKKEMFLNEINALPDKVAKAIEGASKKGDIYALAIFYSDYVNIWGFYKTEKSASKALTRLNGITYYSDYDYDAELISVGDGMELVKININELLPLNSKELWTNWANQYGHRIESEILLDDYFKYFKAEYSLNDELVSETKSIVKKINGWG